MNPNPKNCVCGHSEELHWPVSAWLFRIKRTYCRLEDCPCTQYRLAEVSNGVRDRA